MQARRWWIIGAAMAFTGVLAGTFGAHGLPADAPPRLLETWEIAARYHMYHALALLAVGLAAERSVSRLWAGAGWLFAVGIVIFAGSLYAMVLLKLGQPERWGWLGAITPIGGACFMAGWLALFLAAWRGPTPTPVVK